MNTRQLELWASSLGAALVFSAVAVPVTAQAQREAVAKSASAPADVLRAAVGKLVNEANSLYGAGKHAESLAKLREVDALGLTLTPYETFAINHIRATASLGLRDLPGATQAFLAAQATGKLPAADHRAFAQALSALATAKEDHVATARWAREFVEAGGDAEAVAGSLIRALYLSGDYAGAAQAQQNQINAQRKAGQTPSELQLRLLIDCLDKSGKKAERQATFEDLAVSYPSKDRWLTLLTDVLKKPAFPDAAALDFWRLQRQLGDLNRPADILNFAQAAQLAGFPSEAKELLSTAYANKQLGSGPEFAAHKKLLDTVTKQAADDQKQLANATAASAKDSNALLKLGYALVTSGQAAKGVSFMEQAVAKGGFKSLAEAKLLLGQAQLQAGQKDKALETFKSVPPEVGAGDLAHLWALYLSRREAAPAAAPASSAK